MEKELFVRAEEVARELGISKPYAYKLVREMNEELKKKGFCSHCLLLLLSGLDVNFPFPDLTGWCFRNGFHS